jgi:hypothetical protein
MARYGLEGRERQTLVEIGLQLGVCGERIRQLQQEALVWLRNPAHSQEIRSLLARHTQQQYYIPGLKSLDFTPSSIIRNIKSLFTEKWLH